MSTHGPLPPVNVHEADRASGDHVGPAPNLYGIPEEVDNTSRFSQFLDSTVSLAKSAGNVVSHPIESGLARKGTAVLAGGTLAVSGLAARETVSTALGADSATVSTLKPKRTYRMYDLYSSDAKKQAQQLAKKCSMDYQLLANVDSSKTRRNKYASLKLDHSDPNGHVKAIWKNKKSVKVCGYAVITADKKAYFPKSATKRTKRGGYFVDPNDVASPSNLTSFSIYFKKR